MIIQTTAAAATAFAIFVVTNAVAQGEPQIILSPGHRGAVIAGIATSVRAGEGLSLVVTSDRHSAKPTAINVDPAAAQIMAESAEVRTLVGEACVQLRRVFGEVSIVVERFVDPEATQEEPRVFVVARVAGRPVQETMALLEEFDTEWWLERQSKSDGRVQVTVDVG